MKTLRAPPGRVSDTLGVYALGPGLSGGPTYAVTRRHFGFARKPPPTTISLGNMQPCQGTERG